VLVSGGGGGGDGREIFVLVVGCSGADRLHHTEDVTYGGRVVFVLVVGSPALVVRWRIMRNQKKNHADAPQNGS